jgi:hypothetical protein
VLTTQPLERTFNYEIVWRAASREHPSDVGDELYIVVQGEDGTNFSADEGPPGGDLPLTEHLTG